MIIARRGITCAVVALAMLAGVHASDASYTLFESGQVRPLAMSPDGTRLFAVNTPDNRLEILAIGAGGSLTPVDSVPVGLEPVAVAARSDSEVWVVNHLSDSVSIVDVSAAPPRVVRTVLVGDEPRDIVFAGAAHDRAFITTARRGQHLPASLGAQLTTPGIPRALVWVFDANALGEPLGGTPETILALFGDTPRALAASPDGTRVYAAVFHSGNQTTTIHEGAVCNDAVVNGVVPGPCLLSDGTQSPGGLPLPETNLGGVKRPEVGLIVKYNQSNSRWEDTLGRNWSPVVRFNLPDQDVFAIDASADPPVQLAGPAGAYASVGTVLFNLAVNPANPSRVYVTNTEAINEVRFEGPGAFGGSTVRGHLHEARITVLDGSSVLPRHLNKHLDYNTVPSPPGDLAKSLSTPVGMAVSSDGATLYVAAFGSAAIGVFDTAQLEADTFTPSAASHIALSAGGPSGLVLDETRDRLYVFTRFDNGISVIDTNSASEIAHVAAHSPEPASVVDGRPLLYDAAFTSSNGEASCAVCHVFGDFDSLAWDLGNPDDVVVNDPNPFRVTDPIGMSFPDFHPMKGPMATQSLRGMANHGPMHWRGDRTGGNDPGGDALDEAQAFSKFNPAFVGLLGRASELTPAEMDAFGDFILQVTYPPNPVRALTNVLTVDQQVGENFFLNNFPVDVFQSCNGCHQLNPGAGHFGSDGLSSFEFETQLLKIPHLRNLYTKIGMFGMAPVSFFNSFDNGHQGNQVRGFGFMHDGSADTVFRFINTTVFNQTNPGGFPIPNPGGFPNGAPGDPLRRQVESFLLAFDSNLAPIVGQQVTLGTAVGSGDALVAAKKIMIKATDGAVNKILVLSKDPGLPLPAADSSGDPRCGSAPAGTVKATLLVTSPATGHTHAAPLPCERWELLGSPSAPKGYKYRDAQLAAGAAKLVLWKNGKLKATLAGSDIDYVLQVGINEQMVVAELTSGDARVCMRCGPTSGNGTDGKRFLGQNGSCPVPPRCIADNASTRVDLLVQRAEFGECDLIAKATVGGEARGWLYRTATNDFRPDRNAEAALTDAQLRAVTDVAGQAVTYTCVPPGSGQRLALDRDDDGFFDSDEVDAGSDPADPGDTP
jgi:YVTN family beta-propeller protein